MLRTEKEAFLESQFAGNEGEGAVGGEGQSPPQ